MYVGRKSLREQLEGRRSIVVFWRPDQEIILESSMILEKLIRVGNFEGWESFRCVYVLRGEEKE